MNTHRTNPFSYTLTQTFASIYTIKTERDSESGGGKKCEPFNKCKCVDFEYCDYMLFGLNKRERYDNGNNNDDDDGDCDDGRYTRICN